MASDARSGTERDNKTAAQKTGRNHQTHVPATGESFQQTEGKKRLYTQKQQNEVRKKKWNVQEGTVVKESGGRSPVGNFRCCDRGGGETFGVGSRSSFRIRLSEPLKRHGSSWRDLVGTLSGKLTAASSQKRAEKERQQINRKKNGGLWGNKKNKPPPPTARSGARKKL